MAETARCCTSAVRDFLVDPLQEIDRRLQRWPMENERLRGYHFNRLRRRIDFANVFDKFVQCRAIGAIDHGGRIEIATGESVGEIERDAAAGPGMQYLFGVVTGKHRIFEADIEPVSRQNLELRSFEWRADDIAVTIN